jgi:hypothetical protein
MGLWCSAAAWLLPSGPREQLCMVWDTVQWGIIYSRTMLVRVVVVVGLACINALFAWLGAGWTGMMFTAVVCAWQVEGMFINKPIKDRDYI